MRKPRGSLNIGIFNHIEKSVIRRTWIDEEPKVLHEVAKPLFYLIGKSVIRRTWVDEEPKVLHEVSKTLFYIIGNYATVL